MVGREALHCALAVLRKDLLFEPTHRGVLWIYTPLMCVALLWALLAPAPGWLFDPMVIGLSAGSGFLITMSIAHAVLFPAVVYLGMIQREKSKGSFLLLRALPIDPAVLMWSRVICSSLLSLIPTGAGFVVFALARMWDSGDSDLATPFIIGIHFPLIVLLLTAFVSTLAVGWGLLLSGQQLTLGATIMALVVVMFPLFFSRRVLGVDSRELLFHFARGWTSLPRMTIVLSLLTLAQGTVLSLAFRRKSSYL